ncbi:exodeoxyribonuclease V subunit alpha [Alcanivorax quisquiliarum]|uniref:RecBCD enzyme subunit RecD n=1 Tax=Alcanivorax quisquiliarum TaxID=2933565 RepID=A0ABT0E4L6_9GAMM|nr:exodeoxyribonuclease V subunit alpha [Alcanivorax quisquiliarum]MCK0536770.1 exodeoxyribonuclease V subunit alpha [Alcanivorax quisquiliarum]
MSENTALSENTVARTALGWLESRAGRGLLRPLDVALAQLVAAHAPDDEAVWLVALVSYLGAQGHVCLDLSAPPAQPFDSTDCPWRPPATAPAPDGVVLGAPGDNTPLIIDGTRLYLARHYDAEGRVAAAVRSRLALCDIPTGAAGRLAGILFPPPAEGDIDWQCVAAINCVLHRFGIITGGPGTGKTWTVTRMLALHLLLANEQAPDEPLPRIRMAAPTGKAAARLTESLRATLPSLPLPDALSAALPAEAVTVHRLLGAGRDGRPRYHAGRLLPADIVVIDEASMIDLGLMTQLVAALPEHACLYLIGDRDQLASVEAGSVFADLCGQGGGDFSPALAARLEQEGVRVTANNGQQSIVDDHVTRLARVHRFDDASGIARLADAVRRGDTRAVHALREHPPVDIRWAAPDRAALIQHAVEHLTPMLALAVEGAPAEEVLEAFVRFRILCALRRGPWGAEQINAQISRALRRNGLASAASWYPGRAVLLTRNDWSLGLFNGDAGVAVIDPAEGQLKVAFLAPDGQIRFVPPVRLPTFEDCWAMTIHKSQGSEFDHVALVLPESDSPVLSRELVYTGITRARKQLLMVGDTRLLSTAVQKNIARTTGLAQQLAVK